VGKIAELTKVDKNADAASGGIGVCLFYAASAGFIYRPG